MGGRGMDSSGSGQRQVVGCLDNVMDLRVP